ncbi:serine hydrolase domain-containing protein [Marinigracilibium pacificum]|uniref:Serine hydrolase n=1 Tax=Marinigracilibium pacificum TaxID=2729599 RepID=A0A848J3B0_9BACT|nr:serine hydrolase domain-containing protein [Marinigracilibium pacificum]NMM47662.1 serine hydrolase [Marinigracilibium pacificum]
MNVKTPVGFLTFLSLNAKLNPASFIVLALFIFNQNLFSQSLSEITKEIVKADSLLFEESFNKCNTDVLYDIIDSDFEFYHDQSGTTYGKEIFIEGIKKNICSLSYRPFRKLLPETNEIHLLKSNGEVYGVLQNGTHEFYAVEENKDPYITSIAEFSHLWIKKESGWQLKRVLSYNHQNPETPTGNAITPVFDDTKSIENWLKENKVPALGMAILQNNTLQKVAVYGELEEGKTAPIDAIFNVASLTKPVITMLTLTLVERGQWNLDEPLYKYWVDPDVKNNPQSKKITTRHILSHQSGFKNWRIENESGMLQFDFEPGKGFNYSGEGFQYLKTAIESKFQTRIEILADSLLFDPLKMNNTQFYWSKSIDENQFAKWHDMNGGQTYETYKNTEANAADDLLTTVEDYGRFAEYILKGANLSTELYQQMITQQNDTENNIKIGLGWEILPKLIGKEYALLHSGRDKGVNTLIMLLPETGEGIVIFTNGDNGKNLFFKLIEEHLSLGKQIVGKAN